MRRPGRRAAFAATLGTAGAATLIGAASAFAPSMAAAEAPTPRTAADCRAIADFTLRGQCWDSLDKANQQDSQALQKRQFGLGPTAPSDAAVKPKREKVAKAKKAPKPENDGVHSLILTLADVQNTPRGLLLMTATDGAVWEQTDGDAVPGDPVPGDSLKVSKGILGGYFCQVSRWQVVRCQRDR